MWRNSLPLREIVAILIGPLVVPIIIFLLENKVDGVILSITTAFSYSGMFLLGIPTIMILKRLKRLSIFWLAISGAFFGALIFTAIVFLVDFTPGIKATDLDINLGDLITSFGIGAFFGIAVSVTYGFIANVKITPTAT